MAVTVAVADDRVEVQIADDGVGLPPDRHDSGLANLAVRAATWQGSMVAERRTEGGTMLTWTANTTVPAPARHAS